MYDPMEEHWTQATLNRESSLSYSMKLIQQYEPNFSCIVTHIEITRGWEKIRSLFTRKAKSRQMS